MAPLRDVTAKQLGLRTDARASGAPGDIILNGDAHRRVVGILNDQAPSSGVTRLISLAGTCTVCTNCV